MGLRRPKTVLAFLAGVAGSAAPVLVPIPWRALAEEGGAPPAPAVEAPRASGVLRVQIVRSRTGKPVPGRVTVTGPEGLSREAAAGPEGRARVDGIPRCVPLVVTLSSPGLLSRRLRGVVLPPAEDEHLGAVPLGKAVSFAVVATVEGESPAVGATVEVFDAAWGWGLAGDSPPLASAVTGDDGRAAVAGLSPGAYALIVRAPGFGTEVRVLDLVEGSRRAPVEFDLEPGLGFEGRILDAQGKPAAGVEVALLSSVGPVGSDTLVGAAKSDPRGGFRFEDLCGGNYAIAMRLPDGALAGLGRIQAPSEETAEFRIGARGEIRGRVVDDATGQPLGGATFAVWVSAYGVNAPARYVESAVDGTFRIPGLPLAAGSPQGAGRVEDVSISVNREGYLRAGFLTGRTEEPAPRIVPDGSPPDPAKTWEVRLRRGASSLRGVVKDRAGKPVPGAWIQLGQGDPKGAWSYVIAYSEEDGRYRTPLAPAGPGILYAGAYGLHLAGTGRDRNDPIPPERRVDMPASGDLERNLLLVADSAVEGRMVFADGSPAEGFVPVLSSRTGGGDTGAPSAADGSFSIEELEEGEGYVVTAVAPSGPVGASKPFDLAEGQRVSGISIHVVQPAAVSGRVVGPDGKPAADAWVRMEEGRPDSEQPGDGEGPGFGGVFIQADPDGSFLEGELRAGTWTPYASAPGFLGTRGEPFEVAEGARKEGILLTLAEGKSAEGVVLDPAGAPAAGAFVMAFEDPMASPVPAGYGVNVLLKPRGPWDPDQQTVAGPDGRFRITGLREGGCAFAAMKEGFVGAVVRGAAGDSGVALRLAPAFSIAGKVVDADGAPVAEARVSAEALPGSGRTRDEEAEDGPTAPNFGAMFTSPEIEGLRPTDAEETAADGAFRIEGLAKGKFRVVASKRGHLEAAAEVEAGATDVVLRFGRAATIEGKVVEAGTGKPVRDASVLATLLAPPAGSPKKSRSPTQSAQTGHDGAFVLEDLEEGAYSIRVEDPGSTWTAAFLRRTLHDIRAGSKGLVVEVERGLAISGRATDAEGGEFRGEGMMIGLLRAGDPVPPWGGAASALPDDGRFSFTALLPGRYCIRISPAGGGGEPAVYAAAVVEADAGTTGVVVPLLRGSVISGKVESQAGVRSIDEPVHLEIRRVGEAGGSTILDEECLRADGSFVTPPLDPAGRFDLLARTWQSGVAVARSVRPGTSGVVLRSEAGLTIAGRVVGPDGAGTAAARVEARAHADGEAESGASCDEDGSFVVEGLAPGSYLLYACSNEEKLAPVDPDAPTAAGSAGAVVRTVAGNEFRARFVFPGDRVPDPGEYEVFVEETEGGRWTNHTCYLDSEGWLVLGGLGRCRIRLRLIRAGNVGDFDDPEAPGTYGPFDIPCAEQTFTLEE